MRIRWTPAAADDLENIANYLLEKAPVNAAKLIREIYSVPSSLVRFPTSGRVGKKTGTREWVVSGLPYIVVYRIKDETLNILRVLRS